MAQARYVYDRFPYYVMNEDVQLISDTIKCALYVDAGFTYDETDASMADLAGTELAAGDGYTAGGETLANPAILRDGGTSAFDADDPVWDFGDSKSFRYAVIYKDGVSASEQLLLGCVDIQGATLTIPTGEFRLIWNSNGILPISTPST